MSIDEIRAFRNATPFEPFDIVMNDGRILHVGLPIRIALSPTGRSVSVYAGPAVDTVPVSGITELKPRPLPERFRGRLS